MSGNQLFYNVCDISLFILGSKFTFGCEICTWLMSVLLTSGRLSLIVFLFTSVIHINPQQRTSLS